LSLTIREAQEMVGAARRYGTVFQTGSQQRSCPEFLQACELVRNGYIGEVKSAHVEVGPCSRPEELPEEPVPPGFDYDRWLGPAPWAPYNKRRCGSHYSDGWRRFRDYSGGKMTDWGAHHFDIVQWGLGMDDSGPVEIVPPPVQGRARWEDYPQIVDGSGATELDPTRGLIFRYANGIEAVKDGNYGIKFIGTDGWIEVSRGHLKTAPASLATHKIGPNGIRLHKSTNHHQNWFDCIRSRRRPAADVAIGARSATVCHLGNIALWLDRPIRWDPVKQEIVGDAEANRWLDRPKRAPYRL
ncbi:MAG: gfo/Idh/MocA family oxidoreductase, partial [Phycisphaerae bacterium]|nr:gfo/Idh/MocA family oxidoreductase [Phycisphaerae bacterium]